MLMHQERCSAFSLQPAAALMAGAPPGSRTKIIISSHNYKRTPDIDELRETVRKMVELGADVVKIATTATDISDNTKLFKILQEAQVRSQMSFDISSFLLMCQGKLH
jgi:3-dehydroquinate dehydratase type I